MIVIMVFTSLIFLFVFFPVLLISYYFALKLSNIKKLASLRLMDVVLSILSLAFFAWTGLNAACTFIYFILIIYLIGKALEKCKRKNVYWAKILVLVGVLLTLSGLYIFKYAGYISELVYENLGISIMGSPTWSFLGVSFVSFSAISYIIDIYRGNRCGNFLDVALYLSFFPKVISGPIVLWKDFQPQIKKHSPNLESFIRGINLLAVGCAKKVILADPFGALATEIQTQSVIGIDVPTAWGCAFVYTLQIYYDFSGYSDIARGISFMLGYDLKKNFDFPYVSQSISEFWRRWHISLGSWFREYIYIPWGGGIEKEQKKHCGIFLLSF